ncbi:clathrin light chain B isoform X2 [Petaurus breviceps papuanus]|uniref:clathrin light chain B isoform X2 n=1 Tax=Petaurus breviceps papuanus TaxID=3040969 RepID=UPI0036DDCA96
MADDFGLFSGSGAAGPAEEDPAAAFLAQQESEIAGIENDDEGFEGAEGALQQPAAENGTGIEDTGTTVNGDLFQEANGPSDGYAAVAQADRLSQEPESIRKWREEQKKRLQELDAASKVTEQEWREKAKRDLEEWNVRQNEQVEKNKVSNRASEEAFLLKPMSLGITSSIGLPRHDHQVPQVFYFSWLKVCVVNSFYTYLLSFLYLWKLESMLGCHLYWVPSYYLCDLCKVLSFL